MSGEKIAVGFLGLGIMGEACARNLLKSGLFSAVYIWNRSPDKASALVSEGALLGASPADVVSKCSITFAMLGDPEAALQVVFGENGVLQGISAGKGYIDMSTVDEQTSQRIHAAITAKGGRFLEAPVSGSKKPAIDGHLIILAAGDESLYNEAGPAFTKMGKKWMYLGMTGAGARMKLVVNMAMGTMLNALSEAMALSEKAGLKQQDVLDVMGLGALACPLVAMKGPAMMSKNYAPAFPLKHQQKDMRLALALGDQVGQSMPVAAAANEQFKVAKARGHGDEDIAAVYEATKP
jgi:glyoxylate/succinic semialdehyde reductase